MGRALLLTGVPQIGKTTAVRQVVSDLGRENCVGFYTLEDRTDGERTGFSIELFDGMIGSLASIYSGSELRVDSVTRPNGVSYGLDLEFLEQVALAEMRRELDKDPTKLCVIDEIGPMQLYSEAFREFVLGELARADALVFGSIVQRSIVWTDALKKRSSVETFVLTSNNRDTMVKMVSAYLRTALQARSCRGEWCAEP